MGFSIFSLILLTGFHFRRQFSRSDLLVYLGLIWSKKSIWYQMRYQISDSEYGRNLAGKSGAPARNRTGICHLGNGRSDPFELREQRILTSIAALDFLPRRIVSM